MPVVINRVFRVHLESHSELGKTDCGLVILLFGLVICFLLPADARSGRIKTAVNRILPEFRA